MRHGRPDSNRLRRESKGACSKLIVLLQSDSNYDAQTSNFTNVRSVAIPQDRIGSFPALREEAPLPHYRLPDLAEPSSRYDKISYSDGRREPEAERVTCESRAKAVA